MINNIKIQIITIHHFMQSFYNFNIIIKKLTTSKPQLRIWVVVIINALVYIGKKEYFIIWIPINSHFSSFTFLNFFFLYFFYDFIFLYKTSRSIYFKFQKYLLLINPQIWICHWNKISGDHYMTRIKTF